MMLEIKGLKVDSGAFYSYHQFSGCSVKFKTDCYCYRAHYRSNWSVFKPTICNMYLTC